MFVYCSLLIKMQFNVSLLHVEPCIISIFRVKMGLTCQQAINKSFYFGMEFHVLYSVAVLLHHGLYCHSWIYEQLWSKLNKNLVTWCTERDEELQILTVWSQCLWNLFSSIRTASMMFADDPLRCLVSETFCELRPVFDQVFGPVAEGSWLVSDHRLDLWDDRSQFHICFTNKTGQAQFKPADSA